jgi:hypothetical protein
LVIKTLSSGTFFAFYLNGFFENLAERLINMILLFSEAFYNGGSMELKNDLTKIFFILNFFYNKVSGVL